MGHDLWDTVRHTPDGETRLLRVDPPPIFAVSQAMLAEQKMWLCVLLQGIQETDPSYITPSTGRQPEADNEIVRRSIEARDWMESRDFEGCCKLAQVDAGFARLLSPSKASRALLALLEGTVSIEAFVTEELGDEYAL